MGIMGVDGLPAQIELGAQKRKSSVLKDEKSSADLLCKAQRPSV